MDSNSENRKESLFVRFRNWSAENAGKYLIVGGVPYALFYSILCNIFDWSYVTLVGVLLLSIQMFGLTMFFISKIWLRSIEDGKFKNF